MAAPEKTQHLFEQILRSREVNMHGNALTHFLPDPVDCAIYLSFYIFVCLLVYYVSFVLILNVLNMYGQRTLLLPKTNAPQWRQHAMIWCRVVHGTAATRNCEQLSFPLQQRLERGRWQQGKKNANKT